jgi:hypothetical protein
MGDLGGRSSLDGGWDGEIRNILFSYFRAVYFLVKEGKSAERIKNG